MRASPRLRDAVTGSAAAWLPYAAVACAGLLFYGRVVFFGLTWLDDQLLVSGNMHFLSRWGSVLDSFRQDVFYVEHAATVYYRPLFTISLILDAHLWGGWLGGFHLTNLLIHLTAACLLLSALRRMAYPMQSAFFFALAFVVSPALAQNVAHITTRDDSLLGMFLLAALAPLSAFSRSGGWRPWLGHMVLFACALFSKETAVVFIPAALAFLWLVEPGRPSWRRQVQLAAGWAAIVLVWAQLRHAALTRPLTIARDDVGRSLVDNVPALVQLIGKVLFPFNLSTLPYTPDTTLGWGVLALAFLTLALAVSRGVDWRRVAFGAGWFVVFLAPSMILQSTTMASVVPEKRLYVPIVGFLIMLLETDLAKALFEDAGRRSSWAPLAFVALLAHGFIAYRTSGHYADRLSFWRNAAATSPTLALARRNLGAMLLMDGDLEGAERQFLAALTLNPAEPMAHNNLGLVFLRRGRLELAEREFGAELGRYPKDVYALTNLAAIRLRQGRPADAEPLLRRAIELNPDVASIYEDLARLYLSQRRLAAAGQIVEAMRQRGFRVPSDLAELAGR